MSEQQNMPTPEDIIEAIRTEVYEVVANNLPDISAVIYDAVAANTWTPLPRGSHLHNTETDVMGVGVVALRVTVRGTEVVTERGAVVSLSDKYVLVMGETTKRR